MLTPYIVFFSKRMMLSCHSWVGYYVNNYFHMGNRSTNRVERTHAAIKKNNRTSLGNLQLVTTTIIEWTKMRVSLELLDQ